MKVGRRLALLARGHVYGEKDLLCDPPEAVSAAWINDSQIGATFRYGDGLHTDGKTSDWRVSRQKPELLHSEKPAAEGGAVRQDVRAQKQDIEPAKVTVEDDRVILTLPDLSPDGRSPVWVSLGWDDYAEIHLFNRAGLSAAPFCIKTI